MLLLLNNQLTQKLKLINNGNYKIILSNTLSLVGLKYVKNSIRENQFLIKKEISERY